MDKGTWERTLVNMSGQAVEFDGPLAILERDVATRWTSAAVTVESEVGVVTVGNAEALITTLLAHIEGCRSLAQQKKLRHGSTNC